MLMKIFYGFFTIYWLVLAIVAFCGVELSNVTIGCGLLGASLGMLQNLFRSFNL